MHNGYLDVTLKSRELVCFETLQSIRNNIHYKPHMHSLQNQQWYCQDNQVLSVLPNGKILPAKSYANPANGVSFYKQTGENGHAFLFMK